MAEVEQEKVEQGKPASSQPQYVSVKVMYQAVLFVSLAMSIFSVVVYDRFFTTKIAVYDLPALLQKLDAAEMAKTITKEQGDQKIAEVKALVDSMPSNYIVLAGGTILGTPSRVKDLTPPGIR